MPAVLVVFFVIALAIFGLETVPARSMRDAPLLSVPASSVSAVSVSGSGSLDPSFVNALPLSVTGTPPPPPSVSVEPFDLPPATILVTIISPVSVSVLSATVTVVSFSVSLVTATVTTMLVTTPALASDLVVTSVTTVTTTTSTTTGAVISVPSPTTTAPPSPSPHQNLAAILAGTLGPLALVAAIVCTVSLAVIRRRRRARSQVNTSTVRDGWYGYIQARCTACGGPSSEGNPSSYTTVELPLWQSRVCARAPHATNVVVEEARISCDTEPFPPFMDEEAEQQRQERREVMEEEKEDEEDEEDEEEVMEEEKEEEVEEEGWSVADYSSTRSGGAGGGSGSGSGSEAGVSETGTVVVPRPEAVVIAGDAGGNGLRRRAGLENLRG
ncbi:hypothetical protein A1O7_04931 [Cladophialophora yegresii CBS 114405]|uniref:Uncharacterized protein n=1 Tax=Cladophialophora yegresii CBS 114405 TaxID=1182544 RepID=W9VYL2_9EURO|nr:uncharacterized protein A1O7_04931 [Cladophialophora yegresii CBS 114405]EXJ60778.1 hypothetical protein A1O7_04931 [Cladophialophora yegresii CBS 114405]